MRHAALTQTLTCLQTMLATLVLAIGLGFPGPAAEARGLGDIETCGGEGQPACSVAKAVKVGPKPKGCPKGSFFDLIDGGSCWSCPSGTTRGVTSVKSKSACLRGPGETTRRATKHGRGTGLLRTDCPRNQFWDPNGNCYSCPSGFTRTAAPVTARNACTKWHGPSTTGAKLKKSLACPANSFFDRVDQGSCWSCPKGFVRTLSHVRAGNACAANLVAGIHPVLGQCNDGLVNIRGRCRVKGVCGAKGQRPCTLAERLPSCDNGLAEDFVAHRCVEDRVAETICRTTIDALWAGQDMTALLGKVTPRDLRAHLHLPSAELARFKEMIFGNAKKTLTRQIAQVSPEAERIVRWMNDAANASRIRETFSGKNLCTSDMSQLDQMLLDLGLVPQTVIDELGLQRGAASSRLPRFPNVLDLILGQAAYAELIPPGDPLERHFYMGYELTLSAAKVGGAGLSLMGVTDFRGNGGIYLAPLLQLVTNVTGDFDARIVFFSSANMQTFEGFGYGVGASGSIKGPLGAGLDLIADDKLILRGFGIGPGVGKGALPGDVSINGSHAWPLKRHCADADADTTTDCSACGCL